MNVKTALSSKKDLVGWIAIAVVVAIIIALAVALGSDKAEEDATVPIDVELVDIDSVSSGEDRPYVAPVNINGSTFRLSSFNNKPVPQGQNYTLSFEGNMLSAKFCNSMIGDFLVSEGVIRASLASTKMFCGEPAGLMDMESAFGMVLATGGSFYVEGSTLTIRGSNGEKFAFDVFMD